MAIARGTSRCPHVLAIAPPPSPSNGMSRAEYYYGTFHPTKMHIFNVKFQKLSNGPDPLLGSVWLFSTPGLVRLWLNLHMPCHAPVMKYFWDHLWHCITVNIDSAAQQDH